MSRPSGLTARRVLAKNRTLRRAVRFVRRSAEIERLHAQLAAVPKAEGADTAGTISPFLSWAPPGHFYSPVPDMADIEGDRERIFDRPTELVGVDLNEAAQLALFKQLAALARDAQFPAEAGQGWRYYLNNPSYCIGDALMLYAMLRQTRPSRYLEVGSGWTTALALDVNERHLGGRMQVTCVEPYPDAVRRLLEAEDRVEIISKPVQHVPTELFTSLAAGDMLFIDCSHVVKTGSDAHHLITRVLPLVPPGVNIHIHDIFWPFEYPQPWVQEGRAWSEAYLLHAFLLFNPDFEILLFNDWLGVRHAEVLREQLPQMLPAPGGAIWLRRRSTAS